MNKLKTWKELIILAAAAAVLLVYIIFRTAGNINYELPVLPELDFESIDRVTVSGPQTNLDFIIENGSWLINPEKWIADKTTLKTIVSSITKLKTADLISSSGNPGIYNLDDSHKLTVTVSGSGETLREIYVGKVSASGIYSYIMLPGDENIYSVRGDLPSRFNDDSGSMRSKEILSVPREGVLKLSLSVNDDTITLSSSGTEAELAKVNAVIPIIAPLRCIEFLENVPSSAVESVLEIQTIDGSAVLEIWPKTNDGYPARSSQNGYPVLLTAYTIEKILGEFGVVFE